MTQQGTTVPNENWRSVYVKNPRFGNSFCSNRISTNKYSVISFLPLFLSEQFRRPSNVFFLLIGLLQQIPGISPTGKLSVLFPLSFILLVSAIQEIIQETKRRICDKKVNCMKTAVFRDDQWAFIAWENVSVGDVLRVYQNELFPADVVILGSSDEKGICYVETSNVDGETNLKIRQALPNTNTCCLDRSDLETMKIQCEGPNNEINKFEGSLRSSNDENALPLSNDQFVIRGSQLRLTSWVVVCVVYSGHESKIMLNSMRRSRKVSQFDIKTNKFNIMMIITLVVISFINSIVFELYTRRIFTTHPWISMTLRKSTFHWSFLTNIVLFNTLVPISLTVTMEVVKCVQSWFLYYDIDITDTNTMVRSCMKNTNIIEDLGQINFIFTDKTGTLTKNIMILRSISVGGLTFGRSVPTIDDDSIKTWISPDSELQTVNYQTFSSEDQLVQEIRMFMLALSLCNTVVTERKVADGNFEFKSSSPDEVAIAESLYHCGYYICHRSLNTVTLSEMGKNQNWKILNFIEFTSYRKRMSIIVQSPEDSKIYLFCKGADDIIYSRASKTFQSHQDEVQKHLSLYSISGLRTLCVAYRELSSEVYYKWSTFYNEAIESTGSHRIDMITRAHDMIEQDLTILGATGIEDELQDDVVETLEFIKKSNIRVWMLTGDRPETAINIGHSCGLICHQNNTKILNEDDVNVFCNTMREIAEEYRLNINLDSLDIDAKISIPPNKINLSMIVNGEVLSLIERYGLQKQFLSVAVHCDSVICSRVSPLQKKQVVLWAKEEIQSVVTLAIGDGGNDCEMIQASNVGVGLTGNEGMQAANVADVVTSQFRFIRKLIFVHGALSFRRLSLASYFFYYKNIVYDTTNFLYSFYNAFSQSVFYSRSSIALYNVMFTSSPPLCFGLFDQPCSVEGFFSIPYLYKSIQRNRLYNFTKLILWILNGFAHSAVTFFISYYYFEYALSVGSIAIPIPNPFFGTSLYTIMVLVVTMKAALEISSWNWLVHILMWSGIVFWFLYVSLFSIKSIAFATEPFLMRLLAYCGSSPSFWIIMGVSFMVLLPDVIYHLIRNIFFTPSTVYVNELQSRQLVDWNSSNSVNRTENSLESYDRTRQTHPFGICPNFGYAFSFSEQPSVRYSISVSH